MDMKQARILVVDDEASNVRLIERILEQAGYDNVRSTSDPRRTRALVDELDPDLILLDLLMPHVDGFAVMGDLRSRTPDSAALPIVVLTADITPESRLRSLSAGASDFLTKPFDRVEVLLRINNLLETHFLHEELQRQNEDLEATVQERTSELREMLGHLRSVDAQRRELLSKLVKAQEDERQRIAADIHDDPIQKLTVAMLRLAVLRRALRDPDSLEALEQLESSIDVSIARLRNLVFQLHPTSLDRDGLGPALREFGEKLWDASTVFTVDNQLSRQTPDDTRTIAYRIAVEALTNIRKHAKAGRVDVALKDDGDGLFMRIRDDGIGISGADLAASRPGHLGLVAMRERAEMAGGWSKVQSLPGAGTTVEFWLPCEAGLAVQDAPG